MRQEKLFCCGSKLTRNEKRGTSAAREQLEQFLQGWRQPRLLGLHGGRLRARQEARRRPAPVPAPVSNPPQSRSDSVSRGLSPRLYCLIC